MKAYLASARFAATILENQFSVGPWRFGIDAIIGLIPLEGDTVALLLSLYLVFVGVRCGLPSSALLRMLGNIAIGFIIGLVPILGDAVYLFFRPNMRNLAILEAYAASQTSSANS